MTEITQNNYSSYSKIKCTICDYNTCRKYNLDRHMVSKHTAGKVTDSAGKVTDSAGKVTDSAGKVTDLQGKPAFKCNKCNKIFTRQYGLKVHIETCNGIKKSLNCDHCNREFKHKQNKTSHMKICKEKLISDQKQLIINNTNTNNSHNTTNNTTNNTNTINSHNNTTINVIKYTPNETIEFNSDHITRTVLKKMLRYCNNKVDKIFRSYAHKLLEVPENQCVKKKHITNSYSDVHVGDDKWEVAPDKEVYSKMTQDIALNASDKLDEHSELTDDDTKNTIAEIMLDKEIMQKEYMPVYNLIKSQVMALCLNLTKQEEKDD